MKYVQTDEDKKRIEKSIEETKALEEKEKNRSKKICEKMISVGTNEDKITDNIPLSDNTLSSGVNPMEVAKIVDEPTSATDQLSDFLNSPMGVITTVSIVAIGLFSVYKIFIQK